jgi:hypothetical protein
MKTITRKANGFIRKTYIFNKKPFARNQNSGNVSFTKKQFDRLLFLFQQGHAVKIIVTLETGVTVSVVTQDLLNQAQVRNNRYNGQPSMVMPY